MDRKIWQFTHLCESSDFTPCTYAQSNILYIKYAEKTDDQGLGIRVQVSVSGLGQMVRKRKIIDEND